MVSSLCLSFQVPSRFEGPGLNEAIARSQAGEFVEALAAARAEPDPIRNAQARLYVLYHGGDLSGALQAGLEGLIIEPRNPWLLENVCEIAISLRLCPMANECIDRLASSLANEETARPAGVDRKKRVDVLRSQVQQLAGIEDRRLISEKRALWTIVTGIGLIIALFLRMARGS